MLTQDRRAATHVPPNSPWRSSGVTASHSSYRKRGWFPAHWTFPRLHRAALLFPGVSAPYHESSAICVFSLDRVQALHLQLHECGFNIRFIEAKHLLIRNLKALLSRMSSPKSWTEVQNTTLEKIEGIRSAYNYQYPFYFCSWNGK